MARYGVPDNQLNSREYSGTGPSGTGISGGLTTDNPQMANPTTPMVTYWPGKLDLK